MNAEIYDMGSAAKEKRIARRKKAMVERLSQGLD